MRSPRRRDGDGGSNTPTPASPALYWNTPPTWPRPLRGPAAPPLAGPTPWPRPLPPFAGPSGPAEPSAGAGGAVPGLVPRRRGTGPGRWARGRGDGGAPAHALTPPGRAARPGSIRRHPPPGPLPRTEGGAGAPRGSAGRGASPSSGSAAAAAPAPTIRRERRKPPGTRRALAGGSCLRPGCRGWKEEPARKPLLAVRHKAALPYPARGENLVDHPFSAQPPGKPDGSSPRKARRAPHSLAGYRHGAPLSDDPHLGLSFPQLPVAPGFNWGYWDENG
ncbi:uncharacterized protein WM294_001107 [Sarcoramphus papa]